MDRKIALVIGIDEYDAVSHLEGAVSDARKIAALLEDNGVSPKTNFIVKRIGYDGHPPGTFDEIDTALDWLLSNKASVAVLYFAGHGAQDEKYGITSLVTKDGTRRAPGIPFNSLMKRIYDAKDKILSTVIILDCCHSGEIGVDGASHGSKDISTLPDGVTILTASKSAQVAMEDKGQGVFTTALISGLEGAAADIRGQITPASLYAHTDQLMAPFTQRPIYKANVQTFVSLRSVEPKVPDNILCEFLSWFPNPADTYPLGPECEPNRDDYTEEHKDVEPIEGKKLIYRQLQTCNRAGLVVPVGQNAHKGTPIEHMWEAAMEEQGCQLTELGKHYRKLVEVRIIRG